MRRFLLAVAALLFAFGDAARTPPQMAPADERADRILVDKSERSLRLYRGDHLLGTYRIRLGANPQGHKREEGDEKTPEGDYRIDYKNEQSKFHLSLHVSYPNDADREQARQRDVSPGGDIMIHGQPNARPPDVVLQNDWTAGCIALSNAEIAEVFAATPVGTVVEITP